MKRVVLLGDSIRLGYERAVRQALGDVGLVWGPATLTLHTFDLLTHFWPWVVCQHPDVVHLNAGHWDSRRVVRGEDGNVVPPHLYSATLGRLFHLLKAHTQAHIVWATTTPAFAEGFEGFVRRHNLPGRNYADIPLYNAISLDVARSYNVTVNDLGAYVEKEGPASLMLSDGIHFTPTGYEQLGIVTADVIRRTWER